MHAIRHNAKLILTALALASLGACAIVPPYIAYSGPTVRFVGPATGYYGGYYGYSSPHQHHHRHRGWDRRW